MNEFSLRLCVAVVIAVDVAVQKFVYFPVAVIDAV